MRSILCGTLALVLTLQPLAPVLAEDSADDVPEGYKKFVVTAYYSPLPDQSLYLRGSYEADIRLNGNGTNGASGKEVFEGMIAAPKTYAFGTRIELSGIGIGIVEDRGGAIVTAGERGYDADRVDIWMGEGEDGLIRALTFGKRTVYGRVLSDSTASSTVDVDLFPADRPAVVAYLARQRKAETTAATGSTAAPATPASSGSGSSDDDQNSSDSDKESAISASVASEPAFSVAVGRTSDPDHIREVQEIFIRLGFYSGVADGIYSDAFYQAILAFQRSHGIIKNDDDYGAGYYGPKTRAALEADYRALLAREWESAEAERQAAAALEKRLTEAKNRVDDYLAKIGAPKYGETSKRVRELQKVLKKLGYLDRKDTAYFGDVTLDALVRYQLDRGIITDRDDADAGVMTDSTLKEFGLDLTILVAEE
jgi:3D (Asp-Asp-Asp) domain-containing protein